MVYTTQTTAAFSEEGSATDDYYRYYSTGDACYYLYNGLLIPCIVTHVTPHNEKGVSYTLIGDFNNQFWTAGMPQGPFKYVDVTSMSGRVS